MFFPETMEVFPPIDEKIFVKLLHMATQGIFLNKNILYMYKQVEHTFRTNFG